MVRSSIISRICYYVLVESWLLQQLVVVVTAAESTSTAGEFGTTDGYDVGGTRPICYVTNILDDPTIPDTSTDGTNYTSIEFLNDGMFGHPHNQEHNENETISSVSLLSSVRFNRAFFASMKLFSTYLYIFWFYK
jgi:hypothetical protein